MGSGTGSAMLNAKERDPSTSPASLITEMVSDTGTGLKTMIKKGSRKRRDLYPSGDLGLRMDKSYVDRFRESGADSRRSFDVTNLI